MPNTTVFFRRSAMRQCAGVQPANKRALAQHGVAKPADPADPADPMRSNEASPCQVVVDS
jgi:hypothetical protein